jgi:prepilin-type N-terminal cleavage/methylation domain-containing protein
MFSSKNKKAFTLLEIMLAVAVLSVVVLSIYRFVEGTITAVRVTDVQMRDNFMMDSFVDYLRSQLQSIPPTRQGALTGEPHKFNDIPSDELRWIATAGSGLLTRHAEGEWNVTLTTKQIPGSSSYELGLNRQDIEARNDASWLSLFKDVHGFEIRYFDSRAQSWMDKWTDLTVRPSLIRMRLWKGSSTEPREVIFQLPAVTPGAQLPNFNAQRPQRPQRPPGPPPANP